MHSTIIANESKKIVGLDQNIEAIKNAQENAIRNNLKNTKYILGDITKQIKSMYTNEVAYDTVIIDPPRKGINLDFINLLLKFKPKEIIYVSCNPVTLMRDINALNKYYKLEYMQTFDMFTQTFHIETVVKLELK